MKINLNNIDTKYISIREHNSADLLILNYTSLTQIERNWNELTLMCRGLITDLDGNILWRPFGKFFNYEELEGLNNVPKPNFNSKFRVYEKMDGSLGILYHDGNNWAISTRGSFHSEQAEFGTKILHDKYSDFIKKLNPESGITYLFEIIYPENRIVVDYGDKEDLTFLSAIYNKTGKSILLDDYLPFPKPNYYVFNNISELISCQQTNNFEGFVVYFYDGNMIKFKFDEYKRLHKVISGISLKNLWNMLRNNDDLSILDGVPDEFYIEQLSLLKKTYRSIVGESLKEMKKYEGKDKKFIALNCDSRVKPMLFGMKDEKDCEQICWKLVAQELDI